MGKYKNTERREYHNEHLRRKHELQRDYRNRRFVLLRQKRTMDKQDYRAKRHALHVERKEARRTLREEQRTFFRQHKLPEYPIMSDIFDLVEEWRAADNNTTPFDAEIRVEKDVVYKTVDGEDLVMDVYYPSTPAGDKCPAVMDIPGGGWMIHNRPRRDGYARCFAAMGAVVAVIDHRLCPKVFFPDNLADCADAYNYLVEHADQYNIDPDNIVVTGDSSGGHLTACMGCASSSPEYVERLGIPALKSKIAGLIFVSGAFDFDRMLRIPMTNTLMVRYVSGQMSRKAFRKWRFYKECNPRNYVNPAYPPCFSAGGVTDFLCLGEAEHLAKYLDKHGVPNQVVVSKNLLRSDHCYVLRFPYAVARRDALALYRWYYEREKELGVDLTAGFARVEKFMTQYDDVMSGKTQC